jgi:YfiR/HmsC-like
MALVGPLTSGTLALVLSLLTAAAPAAPESPRPTEYEVKAAFLYNFAKFVKWPEGNSLGPTFVVAVIGEDPFGDVLDRTFAGKTIQGRKTEVRRIPTATPPGDVQILFIGSSERGHLAQILKELEGGSALTVADMDGFTERGGMIAFRLKSDVVNFDINLDQVERARLKMSSQLIRLARNVIGKGGL